ncbi:MAG TPA: ABC transporter substrate-binding protein [Acidimicrobiales bacterium]|nr:ABC transporter substrate-binding protein [Acidimicrobiales bacterium]
MVRRLLLSAICLVTLALVPAVPTSAAARQEGEAKTVRVAIKGFENNITPFTVGFGALPATNDVQHLVYDSLFWSQAKADPEPWLAEDAETADGGSSWTVELRDDVTWHDGTPFTAADVAFSYDYYKQQAGASGRYAHHVFDMPSYDRAEIVDDHTIKLFFKAPAPQFKIMPGGDLPIVAKHIYESVTEPAKMTTTLPVGTGPFKLAEIVPDQRYRLEANEDYFKGKPLIDVLELVVVKDPAPAYTALRTGEIDMVERNVPPELVEQLKGEDGIGLAKSTRFDSTQVYWNARKAPLSDPKLRKAISMGVDLEALVDTVLLGNGRPGRDGFVHPDSPWAAPRAGHEHDPEAAAELLDEAGYSAKDPDGVRKTAEGARLEFSVLVSSFEPTDQRAVELVSEQLAPLGVKLNVEALDPATLRSRRQAPQGQIPTYDAYVSSLEAHAHVDPDGLYYFFHSPGPKGFGATVTGYGNPEFDKLVEQAAGKENAERRRILADAQQILADEVPVMVLYYPDGQFAFRSDTYDGWAADKGHGIFTKRSFLPGYEEIAVTRAAARGDAAPAGDDDEGSGSSAVLLGVGAAAVLVALVAVGMARKRRPAEDE